MLESGKGFAFVARPQRIDAETSHFYIDLVFYKYRLKCFVLIDFNMDKLTHQDIGQVAMYVRMYEDLRKRPGDNPTVGLILRNKFVQRERYNHRELFGVARQRASVCIAI